MVRIIKRIGYKFSWHNKIFVVHIWANGKVCQYRTIIQEKYRDEMVRIWGK